MPRKKVPTTVTPAKKRRATIIRKDLTKLFDFFRIANVQEKERGLNSNNMARMLQLRDICLMCEICNSLPSDEQVGFLEKAEKASFVSHKHWLESVMPILYPDEMKKMFEKGK